MGHAIHFLSRLERLGLQETELALSLYRDAGLLTDVLARVKLPEAQERVAIALRREEGGPHLVVTRAGDFVTCLGEGMSIGELPVVPRSQLDALSRQVETLRERMKIAEGLLGPGKRTRYLFARIGRAGHLLSREEYLGISAFSGMLLGHFLCWMMDSSIRLFRRIPGMLPLANASLRSHGVREKLLVLWKWLWEIAHLTAICGDYGRWIEASLAKDDAHLSGSTGLMTALDFRPIGVRSVMLLSAIGKPILPQFKERMRKPELDWKQIETVAVLVAMGIRFESLNAEITKLVARLPGLVSEEENALGRDRTEVRDWLLEIMGQEGKAADMLAALGEGVWAEWTRKLGPRSPLRFADSNSREARAAFSNAYFNNPVGIWGRHAAELLLCSAGAARLKPEDLYWPAEILPEIEKALDEDWAIEQAARFLERQRELLARSGPDRVEHKAAPNDRCPCGSGKKFKRCCMGKAA